MTNALRHLRSVTFLLTAVVLSLTISSGAQPTIAQTTSVKITSISVTGWTAHTASISFSANTTEDFEAQLDYGPTKNYGLTYPEGNYSRVTSGHRFDLAGLDAGTTYHFRLRVRPLNGVNPTDTSADRTFTTRSSDQPTTPVVTLMNVECTNDACTVQFSTATEANVKIGWGTELRNPVLASALCDEAGGGYPNCAGETPDQYRATVRTLRMTGLTASTEYHFRLAATNQAGFASMSGAAGSDSTVTTAASSRDRTFSTGNCTGIDNRSYPIGSCMPGGEYCSPTGVDRHCTNRCGASCAAGETCNIAGGECVQDPALTNSPYQCNKPACYNNGNFISPASAGCYATWPKCSANTILKVQKDRGCNVWLTCSTSIQTVASKTAPAETLCLSLAACNQLGKNGSCTHYLPQGQCDNDPLRFCGNDTDCLAGGSCVIAATSASQNPSLQDLTFRSPQEVSTIANLSGNVIAGLDWTQQGGNRIIQGQLPWQLMRQIGGNVSLRNTDFETNPPNPSPWIGVPVSQTPMSALQVEFEDKDVSINHVLKVSPVTQAGSAGRSCADPINQQNPNIGKACTGEADETTCLTSASTCNGHFFCAAQTSRSCVVDGDCQDADHPTDTCNTGGYTLTGISCTEHAETATPDSDCTTQFGVGHCSDNAAVTCRVAGDCADPAATCDGLSSNTSFPNATCDQRSTGICSNESFAVARVRFSGAASGEFQTQPTEYYYAEARIRAESGDPLVRFELGHDGFTKFDATDPDTRINKKTYIDVVATSAWQTVSIGPIRGLSGGTRVAAVCADASQCSTFYIDDIQVKPVLQTTTNPDYVTPSCRLYPKEDSPSCDYTDTSGVTYKGWKGYCLENDSVSGSCLSWWPVDIIRGESSVFGSDKVAGYQDRTPLYYCAEAAGWNGRNDFSSQAYTVAVAHNASNANGNCERGASGSWTVSSCSTNGGAWSTYTITPNDKDYGLTEDQITTATWDPKGGSPMDWEKPTFYFYNTSDFQSSSPSNPWLTGQHWQHSISMYREVDEVNRYIYWRLSVTSCSPGANGNCVDAYLRFNLDSKILEQYGVNENDQTGDETEAAAYRVYLKVKEQCTKIVEVVDPSGQNTAFAERVNSKSYTVPELGYKRNTDGIPFGGISTPVTSENPIDWPALDVASSTAGNQARSGPAYACNGDCSQNICRVTNSGGQVKDGATCPKLLSQARSNSCGGIDSDLDGVNDDMCTGGTKPASKKSVQLFDNSRCDVAHGYCYGTNECLTSPVTQICDQTLAVTATGKTKQEAMTNSTACQETRLACRDVNGSLVFSPTTCLAENQDCGTATRPAKCKAEPSGTMRVACNGSCGANQSVVRYTTFQPDESTMTCYKTDKQDRCTNAPQTSYYCPVNATYYVSSTQCRNSPCGMFGCQAVQRKFCQRNVNLTCSTDQDCWTTTTIDPNLCSNRNAGCTCEVAGTCTVAPAQQSYNSYGTAPKTCANDAECSYDPADSQDANRFYAQEKIKRLFARSYGIWDWNPAAGKYELVTGSDLDAETDAGFVGWRPPTKICPTEPVRTVQSCTTKTQACTASLEMTGATKSTVELAKKDAADRCRNTVACDGRDSLCSGGTSVKYEDFQGTCNQTAAGWTCKGRCSTTLDYTLAANSQATPPKTEPVRPTTTPADYCAIPPTVKNATFTTGTSMTAIIDGGNGSIGLKFNTAADPQQVPLQTISVDWGDGSPETFSYPYAPRTDPKKPHIFSHVYTYNKSDSQHCNPATGVCTYPIKIQVQDNWGWCSAARSSGNPATADTKGCDLPPSQWYDSGLKVLLIP